MLSHYMSEQAKGAGVEFVTAVDVSEVDLEKKEIQQDFNKTPCCNSCQTPYKRINAFDRISNQVQLTIWGSDSPCIFHVRRPETGR